MDISLRASWIMTMNQKQTEQRWERLILRPLWNSDHIFWEGAEKAALFMDFNAKHCSKCTINELLCTNGRASKQFEHFTTVYFCAFSAPKQQHTTHDFFSSTDFFFFARFRLIEKRIPFSMSFARTLLISNLKWFYNWTLGKKPDK